jgi:hypothetical protein
MDKTHKITGSSDDREIMWIKVDGNWMWVYKDDYIRQNQFVDSRWKISKEMEDYYNSPDIVSGDRIKQDGYEFTVVKKTYDGMEENKYYTPTIEEFHVGFEFEFLEKGEYIKDTYMCNSQFGVTFDDMPELAKLSRVKHLDREDIESLGWEYVDVDSFVMKLSSWDNTNIDSYLGEGSDRLHLSLFSKENKVHIHNGGSYEGYDGVLLNIKNKSELKRLLKQLGI